MEVLREFARSYAELTSVRLVAEDAGVGRSTVHKFITAGTTPHPRVRRLLALWYLRRLQGVDELELVRPYVAALEVLVNDVPEDLRGPISADILDDIQRGCVADGVDPPRWVTVLRARLSRMQWLGIRTPV
jgi:AcrR family transcriptional regulator